MVTGLSRRSFLTGGLLAGGALGLWQLWHSTRPPETGPLLTAPEDLLGCTYTPQSAAPLESVQLRALPLPDFPGRSAIWGATGRDTRGHIWIGVSATGVAQPSARLYEYDPVDDRMELRGDAVEALQRCGQLRSGEGQMKIHSKIVQGEDGHLYFASMDEQGEQPDGGRLPIWGSHLWRLRRPGYRWEHLFAAREGLIAVAGAGRWIYALGYFNHVLYQYDCRTGAVRSTAVGAAGGHISRNFFCDARGHTFVPRLKQAAGSTQLTSTLVELSPELREVRESPLGHYTHSRDDSAHGIVAYQPMVDGSTYFTTDQGFLYRAVPRTGQPADLQEVGHFHPRGPSYASSLFTSDGRSHLMGLVARDTPLGRVYEWVVHDLHTKICLPIPVTMPPLDEQSTPDVQVYGSVTRDDAGRCYLGGIYSQNNRHLPVLLQVAAA